MKNSGALCACMAFASLVSSPQLEQRQIPTPVSPLILWIADSTTNAFDQSAGDLWFWYGNDQALSPLTSNAHITFPVPSPDGLNIAFVSYDTIAIDENKRNPFDPNAYYMPTNISILNMATHNIIVVAKQPTTSAFKSTSPADHANHYLVRSVPAWSPDGRALVWTQTPINGHVNSIDPAEAAPIYMQHCDSVCMTGNRDSQTVLSNFPRQSGSNPLALIWNDAGVVVLSADLTYGATGRAAEERTILVYHPPPSYYAVIAADPANLMTIKDGKTEYAGLSEYCLYGIPPDCGGSIAYQWILIDQTSGHVSVMPGVPEIYSINSPMGVSVNQTDPDQLDKWRINWPGQVPTLLNGIMPAADIPSPELAISPDGQELAYVDQQGNAWVDNGIQTMRIQVKQNVMGVIWGSIGWRVRPTKKLFR